MADDTEDREDGEEDNGIPSLLELCVRVVAQEICSPHFLRLESYSLPPTITSRILAVHWRAWTLGDDVLRALVPYSSPEARARGEERCRIHRFAFFKQVVV